MSIEKAAREIKAALFWGAVNENINVEEYVKAVADEHRVANLPALIREVRALGYSGNLLDSVLIPSSSGHDSNKDGEGL